MTARTHPAVPPAEALVRNVFLQATAGVALATAGFWFVRSYLDKGQAFLLYLPVVLACAVRFGFGPAVLAAFLSFLCWNFFFLPPFGTLTVADPKDWLSLSVFLVAATVTARLAAQARTEAQGARAREAEIRTLLTASEALSGEMHTPGLLAVLTGRIQTLCHASECTVLRPADLASGAEYTLARAALEHSQTIGFGEGLALWTKAVGTTQRDSNVYVPLRAGGQAVGVLCVGPRTDGLPFSAWDERLIVSLAHHAAVAIARDMLSEQAAQATALREADTLKDSLLSLVSHELRSPLAAIKASASGLLQPEAAWTDSARAQALSDINTQADRLAALVSNLLDLSRLEAGAWQPRKDWCDLAEVAGTALDRLPAAGAARVRLDAASSLPLVQADYTQIALVLTNLLENAVKYTPADSPILLNIQPSPDGRNEAPLGVTVRVRDFGEGFVPGEEEALFERFRRGRRHEGGPVHGTGLGLALCQAIVRAHGGRIWAANAPAGEPTGAVVAFFLPKGDVS